MLSVAPNLTFKGEEKEEEKGGLLRTFLLF
jgi:hypothetical protein